MTRNATLVEILRSAAETAGDARGFRFYDSPAASEFRGYRALDERARSVAAGLTDRGYVAGDVVILALGAGLPFIEAFFGAAYSGVLVAPVAVSGPPNPAFVELLVVLARVSGARGVITDAVAAGVLESADLGIEVIDVADLAGDPDDWREIALTADSIAGLLFTSGSTGDPKGVVMTHRTAIEGSVGLEALLVEGQTPVYGGWAPLHHSMGLCLQVIFPITQAADAVLTTPAQFQRRPMFWLQLLSRHRATLTVAGNFAFDLCVQFATDEQIADLDLSSVTAFLSGSEPVRTETIARFIECFAAAGVRPEAITPAYGSTESMLASFKRPGEPLTIIDADAARLEEGVVVEASAGRTQQLVACGVSVPRGSARITDPRTGDPLPDRRIGEIWLAGPAVSPGYWQNEAATVEVFGAQIAGDAARYVRTGDLGAVIDGRLFVTGRVKDLIIIRGRNIYPQDLEAAVRAVRPGLGVAAAFELVAHPSAVGILVEYDADALPAGELADAAAAIRTALLGKFSLPSLGVGLIPGEGIPRTASGKIRRSIARAMLEQGRLELAHSSGFTTSP
jgi:acyl-CoA synthetase (AMP-forming)/AMP-acid ligase II